MENISDILNLIPSEWGNYSLIIISLLPIIGRGYHALRSGGGLVGLWKGVMFGTNQPKENK